LEGLSRLVCNFPFYFLGKAAFVADRIMAFNPEASPLLVQMPMLRMACWRYW
jgi:hypothetical protein